MYGFNIEPMVGKKIISFTQDSDYAIFYLDDGNRYTYHVDGDCCSSSWIEHATIPPDVEGATILGATQPDLNPHEPVKAENSWESIQVYHTAFQTDKGEIILEYRNSSNGYYGGWMEGPSIL